MSTYLVDDRTLDTLDADWIFVDSKNAGTLTRRRTYTPCKLREVVRKEQSVESIPPLALKDEIVPLGDDV